MLNHKLIAGIVLIIAACIGIYFWGEWEKARFDASLPTPPPATEQPAEEAAREHVHSHEGHRHEAAKPHRHQHAGGGGHRPHRRPKPFPAEMQARLDALVEDFLDGALTEAELDEASVDIFMEGRTLEETVQFLEEHGGYSPALAERLSPYRAFQFLTKVDVRENHTATGRALAKRALAERGDPDFELRLYIARTEPDKATAIAANREILEEEPNQARALNDLGLLLAYDEPVEAIRHLKQANRLDPTLGLQGLGVAHERLGQYDVALDYLKRAIAQDEYVNHFTWMHMHAIEEGDPKWKPIALTDAAAPVEETVVQRAAEVAPTSRDVSSERPLDVREESGVASDVSGRGDAAADAARAEFEKVRSQARQELQRFLQGYTADDRVADELQTLTNRYDPGRLSRAIETLSEHGPEEGMRRLKRRDPELAEQLEKQMKRGRK